MLRGTKKQEGTDSASAFPTLEARQWQQWVHVFMAPEQEFFCLVLVHAMQI